MLFARQTLMSSFLMLRYTLVTYSSLSNLKRLNFHCNYAGNKLPLCFKRQSGRNPLLNLRSILAAREWIFSVYICWSPCWDAQKYHNGVILMLPCSNPKGAENLLAAAALRLPWAPGMPLLLPWMLGLAVAPSSPGYGNFQMVLYVHIPSHWGMALMHATAPYSSLLSLILTYTWCCRVRSPIIHM